MNLQENNKSHQALTVGSLNVLGKLDNEGLNSIHTHLQTTDAQQRRIMADMQKLYENISADGVISANEKQLLKKEITIIETEYPVVLIKAETAKKNTTDIQAYKKAYNALVAYLYNELKIFDDMSTPLTVDREIFNKTFATYYKNLAALQIAKDGANEKTVFPQDKAMTGHVCFDETAQSKAKAEPSYTAWQSKIIEYDCTGKTDIVMTFLEALHNVIILSGELKNDCTLHLYFDSKTGNGAKSYLIVYKLTGTATVTIGTNKDHTHKISQNIHTETYGSGCYALVDFSGNVWHFRGEKGSAGFIGQLDISGVIDDTDFFLIEKTEVKTIQKTTKTTALETIQQYDSPIGEVKLFYDGQYKHGFLEANGLPFSPSVFPEFTEYVKRVFHTGTDIHTGWTLRPKLESWVTGTKIFIKAVQGV